MGTFDFKFYHWEKNTPDQPFLRQPFGDKWEVYTWAEVGQMARKLATGLQSLGLPPKSHIGLISKNCREWIIADIAIMMAGFVSVPFYPTLTGKQLGELIEMGDVKILFAGKLENWETLTTKGEFIVPAPIEKKFGHDENIEQICIVGLGCPQPIALVVLSEIGFTKDREELKESFVMTLGKVNGKLSNYEKVSTIVLVKDAWSVELDLLTPTLKVKRNQVNQKYQDLLLGWHEEEDVVVWE